MEQKHLLFASYEIHPITAGGCGVFIWHAINELLETTNYRITLLLDIPKFECENFINKYKSMLPNHERLNVVCLSDRIPWEFLPMEAFNNIFVFKSYMFYRVIEGMANEEQIDYVEFFDYVGIGYFSVNAKKYEGKFPNTVLGVRGHCTVDLMDLEQCQPDFSEEKIEMYQIEKIALQNADVVLVQTEAWKPLYAKRYGIDIQKIVIAEPPMNNSGFPKYEPTKNKNVLFYGRVFQLKGIDEYIQAGIQYLTTYKENKDTKFYIVGYDGTTKEGTSYTQKLKASIPDVLKQNFVFTGKLDRQQFKKILNDIAVAVFPNYVESFCYSIHELYEAGVPIICRNIPAFSSYFKDEINCLTYDGGIQTLTDKIYKVLETKELQQRLSFPKVVLNKINQGEIYKTIFNSQREKIALNKKYTSSKISILCINNDSQETEILNSISRELLELEGISAKNYVIYMNPEVVITSNLQKINFLGKQVYIQSNMPYNNLQLEEVVLVIKKGEHINRDFIFKGVDILKNKNLEYVMSAYKTKANKIVYPKYAILQEKVYTSYSTIETMLINVKKKSTLQEIFDFRSGEFGQIKYLQEEGYIIPDIYNSNVEEVFLSKENKSNLIFTIINNRRQNTWNPLDLINLIDKRIAINENIILKRRVYHRIKSRLYASNSRLSKFCIKILFKIKSIYLNYFKNN